MIYLVCGGREWNDREYLYQMLDMENEHFGISILIHGANGYDEHGKASYWSGKPTVRGADMLAQEWATARGVHARAYPADWRRYGRAAGPIRNQQMLDENPDVVIAFHANIHKSTGTRDMIARANRKGTSTWVYDGGLGLLRSL